MHSVPSQEHEVILELFRNRPVMAAELLCETFHVELPRFTRIQIEPADLTEIIPRELRADLLVLLLDEQPVLVIIVEAQLGWDPNKQYTWPALCARVRKRGSTSGPGGAYDHPELPVSK